MANTANKRILLVDNSAIDISAAQGKRRIHKLTGWYRTSPDGFAECLEPVDYITADLAASGDKVITGIEFVDAAVVLRGNCAGGDNGPGL